MSERDPIEIDGTSGEIIELSPKGKPARYRAKLDTLADVKREMCRLYRESRSGLIETSDCSKLVYVLKLIGDSIRDHELEARLEALEQRQ